MRVLFATAELAPFVKVGGLGDAAAGLIKALLSRGVEVEVVLPDYGNLPLAVTERRPLDLPPWAGPTRQIRGRLDGFPAVTLIESPLLARPHPYNDDEGRGWPDNDTRFMIFSAAISALARLRGPDVLHLNDWHTGAALGLLTDPPPSVFTIHNLAYQGQAPASWLARLPHRSEAYEWYGGTNPLTGAVALADRVTTVSPTFAIEATRPETGFGANEALAARGDDFTGILNGIDTEAWDPLTDPHLAIHYDSSNPGRKREIGRRLALEVGWDGSNEPLIGMVTRLTDQKGVDLALDSSTALRQLGARMILLGAGERSLSDSARTIAREIPDRFHFREGYDEGLAHRIFAGSDLYLVPSRFEPAGLTQMQAMRYGSIPVVTDVGGLHDTVSDADAHPETGNGLVALQPSTTAVADALGRGIGAWRSTKRRGEIRRRGMTHDWSWSGPASEYHRLYSEIASL